MHDPMHPSMPTAEMAPASGFSADWLALREPFDAEARQRAAQRLGLAGWLAGRAPAGGAPWRIIDLACGTGSNLRWLAPWLGGHQQWLVVDRDERLLTAWPGAASSPPGSRLRLQGTNFDAEVIQQRTDLADPQGLQTLPWAAADLVTASALLDLVSAAWLDRLVEATTASGCALLMALSVDGRHRWLPADPEDAAVARAFAAHQRRDKGFGPALGPAAVPALRRKLQRGGYEFRCARSDWRLDGHDASAAGLLQQLEAGMAEAAIEQQPGHRQAFEAWRLRQANGKGRTPRRVEVGHLDLIAWPAASGAVSRR